MNQTSPKTIRICYTQRRCLHIQLSTYNVKQKRYVDPPRLENGDGEEIPLSNVDAETLKKVKEWMEHHKDDEGELDIEKPLRSDVLQVGGGRVRGLSIEGGARRR